MVTAWIHDVIPSPTSNRRTSICSIARAAGALPFRVAPPDAGRSTDGQRAVSPRQWQSAE